MSAISERAMLSALHISSWSGMMVDREVTDEVNESYKAAKAAGRYNKRLVASRFFEGISSAHNAAKRVHKVLTLPWEDDGTRVLATPAFMTYSSKMKECRLKVEAEVDLFKQPETRNAYIEEARQRLGKMFNEDDFPSEEAIADKFGFDVEIKPLPEAGDFRAQLSESQTKAIIKDIERRSNERLENAMNDVFLRIQDVVKRMSERLRDYQPPKDGNKAEGIIRDSLVYNIHELATDVLPVLNITSDKRIDDLRKQLLDDLVEHSPEILRADAKVRQDTISKADKILKKVQGYIK